MNDNIEQRSIELIINNIRKIGYCYVAEPNKIIEKAKKYGFDLVSEGNCVSFRDKQQPRIQNTLFG